MIQEEITPSTRIAVYDDLLSSPRIIDVPAMSLPDHIDNIATQTYELSHAQGGLLPYTVIREIVENFIHAGFRECTVSVLDGGNTLSFSDQGPGISRKDLVIKPGFTSATTEMKKYIRGVGSGLPIAREYLLSTQGSLTIEDNAVSGTVVTISLNKNRQQINLTSPALSGYNEFSSPTALPKSEQVANQAQPFGYHQQALSSIDTPGVLRNSPINSGATDVFNNNGSGLSASTFSDISPQHKASPHTTERMLNKRQEEALILIFRNGLLGTNDLVEPLNISAPTATRLLQELESFGLVVKTSQRKRVLSDVGLAYIQKLL
jgi:anti-sigma regulatory factor (Ser/Thr protein kinase)